MKKINSTGISDFLDRFEMNTDRDFICFDAKVLIHSDSLIAQTETEIEIKRIPGFTDTIYFLDPDNGLKQFPTKFENSVVDFYLSPKYGLILTGTDKLYGNYKVLIQPLNTDCAATTLDELHAKNFN